MFTLSWPSLAPFFGPTHEALAARLARSDLEGLRDRHDAASVAAMLGALGLYAHLVPEKWGGAPAGSSTDGDFVDVRGLVLIREALGQISPLADSIFAVQGLGSYPISLAGSAAQRALLSDVVSGARIGAFALTEPEAGSDVQSMRATATATANSDGWVLDGEKVYISNVGIANHYIVFAKVTDAPEKRAITAFLVPADAPGLRLEAIPMSVPHPLGRLRLRSCRVAKDAVVGEVGGGMRLALATLDTFRISVGAAANGMATRALALTLAHVRRRRQFGAPLSDQQLVRGYLADMATELDAARLLVARAAHLRDTRGGRLPTEAAMAKMYATEAAQRIIDLAVQLHGGLGVTLESEVERLYREIRPLRIYEGTTEIQKLIIARGMLEASV